MAVKKKAKAKSADTGKKEKQGKKAAGRKSAVIPAQAKAAPAASPALGVQEADPLALEHEHLRPNTTFTRPSDLTQKQKLAKLAELKQQYPGVFMSADQLSSPYLLRRPTGIIELDIALGGGFPAGGGSILSGPYNSGKSWLLWRLFAMQQKIYGNDLIIGLAHPEGALDYAYARNAGCMIAVPDEVINGWNEMRHQRGQPEFSSAEVDYFKRQIGSFMILGGGEEGTGEVLLQGVLDMNKQNIANIIAIDSISSLSPQADIDKTLDEERKRAAHATMMKAFWTNYANVTRIGKTQTSLMMVQQVVANQNKANAPSNMQKYIQDWEIKGGEATKHYKLIDLVLWSAEKIRDKAQETGPVLGKWIKYKTLKGKAGTHDNIEGSFAYYYNICGNDVYGELLASGIQRGIIVSTGSYITVLNAQTRQPITDVKFKTDGDLRTAMAHDVNFEFAVRREIMATAGVQCLYR